MKIYRHKQNERRWLTARGVPAMSLPSGFVESDYFENTLIHAKCRDQYNVAPAEIRHAAGHDLNGKTVLVMRRGGYGDLLWISRIVRKLKEIYPDATFDVASYERHHMVFAGNLDIRTRYDYPIPLEAFDRADYHLSFEKCIEPDRSGRSVYQLFAERAGVTLAPEECIPIYATPPGLSPRATRILKSFGVRQNDVKVMIHMGASMPWKSWPPQHVFALAATLGRFGIKVFLAGNRNTFQFAVKLPENVFQVCYREQNGRRVDCLSMEESVSLMAKMDLLIAQDSGLKDFAAALGVPTIAIMGPFPGKAYVGTYPNCECIEDDTRACPLMPCFPHNDNRCPNQDRDDSGHTPCLFAISPWKVLERIEKRFGLKVPESMYYQVNMRRVA